MYGPPTHPMSYTKQMQKSKVLKYQLILMEAIILLTINFHKILSYKYETLRVGHQREDINRICIMYHMLCMFEVLVFVHNTHQMVAYEVYKK